MLAILLPFLSLTFSMFVAAKLLKGMTIKGGLGSHLIVSALFGLISFFAGWCLFFVIGVATLGFGFVFAFVTRWVVAAILLIITDRMTDRLKIAGFGTALLAAFLMSVVGTVTEFLVHTFL
ncbi:MAG: phage holin family protein [Myxococcota bacterium]